MFLQQSLSYKNPFWMFLLGSFIVIIFNVIGQLPLTFVIIQERVGEISSQDPMDLLRNIDKNLQLFLLLIPFAAGFIGLWLVLKKLHLRPLLSIVTARKAIDWRRIFFAFLVWTLVTVLLVVGDYFISPESYEWNFTLSKFAILFIIAVLFIPIQTSLEEFIFRGYLMQGFSGLFKNSWVPLLMTSLIFGCLHLFNPEVEKLGYGILVYYIGTGLFLGIMTIMDDGIELALGFHAANNLTTALLVTSSWTAFQTESVLIDISEPSLGPELILSLLLFYPLLLLLMSYKYGWSNWKSKLISKF
ncbi:CPBP family intramembrane metalloprotease [Flavobacteriaceae bacterium]|jgi:membrane protease YdiL (CAAX protease family)|nr:CPBP family intramembrane metalloprotease [Flavobacteriaceae bacterium]MDC0386815.1 CPBP family intramembrane metalloprotease [Flavobacteriaceae bacterium]